MREGFISCEDLQRLIAERYAKNDYGVYLKSVIEELKQG